MPANASSLPTEILCIIFFHAIERDDAYWESNEHLDWISSIAHTCQKWRHVALDWPAFWAESICCSRSNEATDCFLERAQSAPLAFRTPYSRRNKSLTEHQLTLAAQHLSRIQVLDSPLPRSFLDNLRERVREQLVYLRVNRWVNAAADGLAWPDEQNTVALGAPALRELKFHGTFFAVNAPNLRTLEIEDYDCYLVLFGMLRAVPLLEHLTLRNIFGERLTVYEDGNMDIIPVNMPCLRRVELESRRWGDRFQFCRFFHAPSDTSIKATQIHEYWSDLPGMMANLDRYHSSSAYNTLIVRNPSSKYVHEDNSFTVIWRSSELALKCRELEDDPKLWLATDSPRYHRGSTVELTIRILPAIHRENIHFLDLADMRWHSSPPNKPDVASMRALLAPFVNVEAVFLSVHQTKRHIVALCQGETIIDWPSEDDEEEDEGAAPAACVLPALRHLVVNELSNPHGKRLSVKILEDSWRAIIHVLKERKRAGCPIRQLTLADTYRFPKPRRGDDSRDVLEACDEAYLARARKLAEKLVDARGSREWSVLEYDQKMQGLFE